VNILVVEDEARIAGFVRRGLEGEGYSVTVEEDGRNGLDAALRGGFDLVLLDLALPELSGEEVLAGLRERQPTLPVIVVTAKDAISDRVSNLEAGADDYLIKPFSFAELLARIQVRLRNSESGSRSTLRAGGLELDPEAATASVDGRRPVELSRHEVAILDALVAAEGSPVTVTELQRRVWGADALTSDQVVVAYVDTLSRRLGEGILEGDVDGYRIGDASTASPAARQRGRSA